MELTPDWKPLTEEPETLRLMTQEQLLEVIIRAMIEEGVLPRRRRRRRAHRRADMPAPPPNPPPMQASYNGCQCLDCVMGGEVPFGTEMPGQLPLPIISEHKRALE